MKKIVLILMMIIPLIGMTTDYYVNDNSLVGDVYTSSIGSNTNDGLTPSTPLATLTKVLTLISAGDVIYIDAGNYNDDTQTLSVNNVSIIGAGSELTIFDVGYGYNSYLLSINGLNIEITGISASGYSSVSGYKGKVFTVETGSSVVFTDVSITNNGTNTLGGDAALVIQSNTNVVFQNSISSCNLSTAPAGGGIQIGGGDVSRASNVYLRISNSDVSNNSKTDNSGLGGGLVVWGNNNVNVIIENSLFENNVAYQGGGIYLSGCNVNITNTCFNNNLAHSTNGYDGGGAIAVRNNVRLNITECSFIGNVSYEDGGAIASYGKNSTTNITNTYFSNNSANDDGDAIFCNGYSGNHYVYVTESYFNETSQDSYGTSDGYIDIRTSSTRYRNSVVRGNNLSQTLPTPDVSCIETSGMCGMILSVELKNFYGINKDNVNVIMWETSTENNNSHFILSRMNGNSEWFDIKKVNGSGNSNSSIKYTVYDREYDKGDNYYKLTQYDYDGKFETFDIILISNTLNELTFKIYDVMGRKVDEYCKGVVIYKYSDGTFERVTQ